MSDITPYVFEGHHVRTLLAEDGTPLFVLGDVCRVLDIANPWNVAKRLDPDDLHTVEVIDSMGRTQRAHAITESGVIDVTLDSRKPDARKFRRWLTHEVVPQILRTGTYGHVAQLTRRDLAQMVIEEADRADRAEAQVLALAPRAEVADKILDATGDMSVADAAKALTRAGIPIGQNRLFAHLGRMGWTYRARADGRWRPTQTAIETGRLSSLPQSHTDPHTGELVIDPPQVRVTPKGLQKLLTALTPQRELEVVS